MLPMKNNFSRRDILKLMGLTGYAALFHPLMSCADNKNVSEKMDDKKTSGGLTSKDTNMLSREIRSTGELLPVVGLGSWLQFDVGSSNEERQPLTEVLLTMNELGGKLIDSSPMYGSAEQVIGDLTTETGKSDDFFYATKVWTSGEDSGISQMEDSFRKLKRKTIDLMQVHNLLDWQIHLNTINKWKDKGRIRYSGITHYTTSSHEQLEQIINSTKIDFVQFNYSIRVRNAERSLLNTAMNKNVSVIINEPFEKGELFKIVKGKELPEWAAEYDIKSWAQFFLKYILSHPAVNCVIPGTSNPKHLADNMQAGYGKLPDEKGIIKMAEYIENL